MDVLVKRRWFVVTAIWIVLIFAFWLWTVRYEFATYRPSSAYAHSSWPSDSSIDRKHERSTLVFFVHPKCPCTRASVRELAKLLASSRLNADEQPCVLIVASHPRAMSDNWDDTDILRSAVKLPRATVILDPEGVETSRFGAVNSGTVMFYTPGGRCLFVGGVTASRGHEGDNVGINILETLLNGQDKAPPRHTPVFGCQLCRSQND